MHEVVLEGKTYVGSKFAAQECGYTQDYVGQLARKGLIDAKRVSGQWYVFLDSLRNYKSTAETFKPEPPKYQPDPHVESSLNLEGKEYVSAASAAKLTEYNQDYVGQLARAGKIPSRQIGNRWYVEREALINHKKEKDALLRAVQAESVGLHKPAPKVFTGTNTTSFLHKKLEEVMPAMLYKHEEQPLFPELRDAVALKAIKESERVAVEAAPNLSRINIRVIHEHDDAHKIPSPEHKKGHKSEVAVSEKSMFNKAFLTSAVAVVLLLVVGFGTYKRDVLTQIVRGSASEQQTAGAAVSKTQSKGIFHRIMTKELVYIRK
jgi:hypothetical protein